MIGIKKRKEGTKPVESFGKMREAGQLAKEQQAATDEYNEFPEVVEAGQRKRVRKSARQEKAKEEAPVFEGFGDISAPINGDATEKFTFGSLEEETSDILDETYKADTEEKIVFEETQPKKMNWDRRMLFDGDDAGEAESLVEGELKQEEPKQEEPKTLKNPEPSEELLEKPEGAPKQEAVRITEKLVTAVTEYMRLNSGVYGEDATVRYCDGVKSIVVANNEMRLPVRRVYVNGIVMPFNSLGEVRVPNGVEVEVDFGVSVVMPDGFGIELHTIDGVDKQYGLSLAEPVVSINRQEALYPIVAKFKVLDGLAYVNKACSLVAAKFVSVG